MYICLNFPLYVRKLTEIARAEDENIAQCRGRREEKRRWRSNSNSLLSKERKVCNKKPVPDLICCLCLVPGVCPLQQWSCLVPLRECRCCAVLEEKGCPLQCLWHTNKQFWFPHVKDHGKMWLPFLWLLLFHLLSNFKARLFCGRYY